MYAIQNKLLCFLLSVYSQYAIECSYMSTRNVGYKLFSYKLLCPLGVPVVTDLYRSNISILVKKFQILCGEIATTVNSYESL